MEESGHAGETELADEYGGGEVGLVGLGEEGEAAGGVGGRVGPEEDGEEDGVGGVGLEVGESGEGLAAERAEGGVVQGALQAFLAECLRNMSIKLYYI